MTDGPLSLTFDFWKPVAEAQELERLGQYRYPGERVSPGVHSLRTDAAARHYRLVFDGAELLLFAAVHPTRQIPDGAEVIAEIRELSGEPYSFVLWYPVQRCAELPFDPNEAITALRREAYMPASRRTVLPSPVLSAYYAVRPLLPVTIKQTLRRALKRSNESTQHYLSWPSDRSLDLLLQLLMSVTLMALGRGSMPFLWFWPDGHPWAAILTHDVETAEGLARVPHVMEIEEEKGFRSSFNFVPLDYAVSGELLGKMGERGFEVGVHGYTHDGLMFAKWSTFVERVVKVNEFGRQWGAAGFRSPATYRNLDWFHLLGFEYDSSVTDTAPFEPQPGGCGSVFPYLVGDLVEMPMTLPQDHTLFSVLGHSDSRVWLEKLSLIRDGNGMACVLTHPDPGEGYIGRIENERRYKEVLEFIRSSDAWTPLPRELARWWRARSAAEPGSDKALPGAAYGIASLGRKGHIKLMPPVLSADHEPSRR